MTAASSAAASARSRTTADRALDVAEKLVQTRGFNGFSYADIASALRITKASLHYHFPTKAALGEQLILRYHERFFAALADLEASTPSPGRRLHGYTDLYARVLRSKRMCLCGMLAAEHVTLPKAMRAGVRRFFDANERWLATQIDLGRRAEGLRFSGSPPEAARTLLGALQGAMLLARSSGKTTRFVATTEHLLSDLGVR